MELESQSYTVQYMYNYAIHSVQPCTSNIMVDRNQIPGFKKGKLMTEDELSSVFSHRQTFSMPVKSPRH